MPHEDNQSISLTDCDLQQTLTFRDDEIVENYFVDNDPCEFSTQIFPYQLESIVLTFTIANEANNGGDFVLRFNVLTLNSTTLVLEYFYDNENGELSTEDIEVWTFERQ